MTSGVKVSRLAGYPSMIASAPGTVLILLTGGAGLSTNLSRGVNGAAIVGSTGPAPGAIPVCLNTVTVELMFAAIVIGMQIDR